MHPSFSNIGAFLSCKRSVSASAVAAGAGDNTETNGTGVDRYVNGANGAAGVYQSATFFLMAQATLSAGKKATLKATLQESSDNGGSDAFADLAATLQPEGAADSVVLTLSSGGGSTEVGSYQKDVDLSSCERYIRAQVHIDLDAGATDTGFYCAGFIMGGVSEGALPVT